MDATTLTRRAVLKTAALATTALGAPFVHGAYAAGKLSCGFWDHWVPGANEPLAKLCREWADREKVDLTVDFINSQGDKLALTATAEGQARSGHDILQFSDWYPAAQAENLEAVDDLVTALIKEHGKVLLGSEYIGKHKGRWFRPASRPRGRSRAPASIISGNSSGSTSPGCTRLACRRTRHSPMPGPGTGFWLPRKSAPQRGMRSACRSAPGATRSTG